jgi:hypothetical protein
MVVCRSDAAIAGFRGGRDELIEAVWLVCTLRWCHLVGVYHLHRSSDCVPSVTFRFLTLASDYFVFDLRLSHSDNLPFKMDHSMHAMHDMDHGHSGHGDMDMGDQCSMNVSPFCFVVIFPRHG